MDELWLIGRILYCALFVSAGIGQLVDLQGSTRYAEARGVGSAARAGVIASGVAFILGGVSILFGIWGDSVRCC
jgi:putative oxidoreductase